ncbi:hypothetical protein EN839_34660, partial [Mesorhizobium sp. M1C.F.Ca.ET.196.01.1.1]
SAFCPIAAGVSSVGAGAATSDNALEASCPLRPRLRLPRLPTRRPGRPTSQPLRLTPNPPPGTMPHRKIGLAVAHAAMLLERGMVERIVLSRPAVE